MTRRTALRRAHSCIRELRAQVTFARESSEAMRRSLGLAIDRELFARAELRIEQRRPLWRLIGRRFAAWLEARCR